MFTAEERTRLRANLLEAARADMVKLCFTPRFKVVIRGLLSEIEATDHVLFKRLKAPLTSLIDGTI